MGASAYWVVDGAVPGRRPPVMEGKSLIPLIGRLFEGLKSIFGFIDDIHTSDEEKLAAKAQLMGLYQPVLEAAIQLQMQEAELRARIHEVEIKSDRILVWSLRPLMTWLTFAYWVAVSMNYVQGNADNAFYAFGIVAGIFSGTRGIEKVVRSLKAKEII